VPDPEQPKDTRMPLRLRLDSSARVQEQNCELCIRSAGSHVARVLLMPGSVGKNELSPRSAEITVGDVDSNALLALCAETVGLQRKFRSEERRVGKGGG